MRVQRVIPEAWLPPARVHRVILHWTAGAYRVSDVDRAHYHVILQDEEALLRAEGGAIHPSSPILPPSGDVQAIRGYYRPADNDQTADGRYAAHTHLCNTGSFGLAAACMAGAHEGGPYGSYPLTRLLWERLAQGAAEVCLAYGLEVDERTVLQHGEVERVYGREQRGKWDCTELPFEPALPRSEVCDQFRRKVRWYRQRLKTGTA